jgi:hypothetical protein
MSLPFDVFIQRGLARQAGRRAAIDSCFVQAGPAERRNAMLQATAGLTLAAADDALCVWIMVLSPRCLSSAAGRP